MEMSETKQQSCRAPSSQLNLKDFNETSIIKKMVKSKVIKDLKVVDEAVDEIGEAKGKRGRNLKYNSDEERKEARRRRQREYRLRKKKELESLRKLAAKSSDSQDNDSLENE